MAQIAGQQPLPGGAPAPGLSAPGQALPGAAPVGGGGGGVDPALQQAIVAADQIFTQATGTSFLAMAQSGQVDPQAEQMFMQILQQVVTGNTNGPQEAVNATPFGI